MRAPDRATYRRRYLSHNATDEACARRLRPSGMGSITSDELNFLVYRYLHESGEPHRLLSASTRAREGLLVVQLVPLHREDPRLEQRALVRRAVAPKVRRATRLRVSRRLTWDSGTAMSR